MRQSSCSLQRVHPILFLFQLSSQEQEHLDTRVEVQLKRSWTEDAMKEESEPDTRKLKS
jgi:hypothetical protein